MGVNIRDRAGMDKIKILHVTFDMAIGGTEQVIRQLVENTNADKFDISILCIEKPIGDIGQELIKNGFKITAFNRQAGFDFKLIKQIREYIKTNKIDVLHCHQYSPFTYGVLAALFTRVKVIFTEHGRFYPDRSSWKRKLINPVLALFTNQITSISKATKDALIKFEALPENKIQVIYNGIKDLSKNRFNKPQTIKDELNIKSNVLVLGTISRLDPIKNHKMMLIAFKDMLTQIPNAKMLVVGDGPLRQEIEQLCVELNITQQVILTGFKIEPQQYLNIMDVFLLPSFSEGTSMTLLEAMSFSKPCVVTDVGGNPEIVIDGETGIVVPSDNQQALTRACLSLLEDQDLRTQYGNAGQQRFLKQFIVENMINQFEDLYSEV